ncbi:hypothetical protein CR956_01080 [Candidatus Saccharibacteria bacterium]|nr:MAG: hypothetical protein CR956_01080 [Candidatus Saccharibacteria bacterium]
MFPGDKELLRLSEDREASVSTEDPKLYMSGVPDVAELAAKLDGASGQYSGEKGLLEEAEESWKPEGLITH